MDWARSVHKDPLAAPISWDTLKYDLFAGQTSHLLEDPSHGAARILFVGRCCAAACDSYASSPTGELQKIDQLILGARVGAG